MDTTHKTVKKTTFRIETCKGRPASVTTHSITLSGSERITVRKWLDTNEVIITHSKGNAWKQPDKYVVFARVELPTADEAPIFRTIAEMLSN
jgi:hypothetical protein